jgi:hypothetical protein
MGFDHANSEAVLITELDSSTLASHYTSQLKEAGWTCRAEGQAEGLAWSTWTFHDEDGQLWQGLLFAVEMPEVSNRRFLYARADLVPS